jgi:hypothetical protein
MLNAILNAAAIAMLLAIAWLQFGTSPAPATPSNELALCAAGEALAELRDAQVEVADCAEAGQNASLK